MGKRISAIRMHEIRSELPVTTTLTETLAAESSGNILTRMEDAATEHLRRMAATSPTCRAEYEAHLAHLARLRATDPTVPGTQPLLASG